MKTMFNLKVAMATFAAAMLFAFANFSNEPNSHELGSASQIVLVDDEIDAGDGEFAYTVAVRVTVRAVRFMRNLRRTQRAVDEGADLETVFKNYNKRAVAVKMVTLG
jgi:uridine kinase